MAIPTAKRGTRRISLDIESPRIEEVAEEAEGSSEEFRSTDVDLVNGGSQETIKRPLAEVAEEDHQTPKGASMLCDIPVHPITAAGASVAASTADGVTSGATSKRRPSMPPSHKIRDGRRASLAFPTDYGVSSRDEARLKKLKRRSLNVGKSVHSERDTSNEHVAPGRADASPDTGEVAETPTIVVTPPENKPGDKTAAPCSKKRFLGCMRRKKSSGLLHEAKTMALLGKSVQHDKLTASLQKADALKVSLSFARGEGGKTPVCNPYSHAPFLSSTVHAGRVPND
jgi:hypothetical protein